MNARRYSRQIPLLGEEGQQALRSSRVGLVGLGGLGCNALTHLATAGVGSFVLVDHQFPEESNLNRQFVHCLVGPSVSKADSAAAWVASLNPDAEVVAVTGSLEGTDAVEMLRGCDVILDCLDNNESRLRLNSFALEGRIPVVHAAVQEWHGQVMVVDAGVGPCLGCILPSHECSSPPVIGSVAGVIGSLQASEAIKVITGIGEVLIGRLLSVDISRNSYQSWDLERKPGCPHCSSLIE